MQTWQMASKSKTWDVQGVWPKLHNPAWHHLSVIATTIQKHRKHPGQRQRGTMHHPSDFFFFLTADSLSKKINEGATRNWHMSELSFSHQMCENEGTLVGQTGKQSSIRRTSAAGGGCSPDLLHRREAQLLKYSKVSIVVEQSALTSLRWPISTLVQTQGKWSVS